MPLCRRAFVLSCFRVVAGGNVGPFPIFPFGIWNLEFVWNLGFGILNFRPLAGASGRLFFQNRFEEVLGRDIPIKGNLFDENLSGHLPVRVVVAAQRGVNSLNGMPIPEFRFLL